MSKRHLAPPQPAARIARAGEPGTPSGSRPGDPTPPAGGGAIPAACGPALVLAALFVSAAVYMATDTALVASWHA